MFNDELWRIVSLANIKTNKNDTSEKYRAKIIRTNSLGKYSYDSSNIEDNNGEGTNDWTKSSLMQELNELYYNQKDGTCNVESNNKTINCDFSIIGLDSNAKYLIDDALYHIPTDKNISDNLYPQDYYNKEKTDKTWIGKVGIIYASDYMYASDINICKATKEEYVSNNNCNNWLYKMHDNVINNLEINKASTPREIYPTVYLKNNVTISEGTGTKNNPLILEIDS